MQVPQRPETLHLPGAEVIGGARHLGPELGSSARTVYDHNK